MPSPHVFQLNVSAGGVPKTAVARAEITVDGLTGDRQNDLKHHGGPERAVCLFSLERILALQEEGHPLFPGAAGENVTVAGLAWEAVQPGSRIQLGSEVRLEVTRFTTPCAKLRPWFANGDFMRLSPERNPGWARVYAKVLAPGTAAIGDGVMLEGPAG